MGFLQSVGDISALTPTILWKRNALNEMDFKTLQIDDIIVTTSNLQQGIQKAILFAKNYIHILFEPKTNKTII
jgi:hypothetical protein